MNRFFFPEQIYSNARLVTSLLGIVLLSTSVLSYAAWERCDNRSDIEKAVDAGDLAAIESLSSTSANINQQNRDGLPLLFYALWKSAPKSLLVVDFLLRKGVSIACTYRGENPMEYVLNRVYPFQAKKERVQLLVDVGAYVSRAMVPRAMHREQDERSWAAAYGAHSDGGSRGLSCKEWQELKQIIEDKLKEGMLWRAQLPVIVGEFFPAALSPIIGQYAHPDFYYEPREKFDNSRVVQAPVAQGQVVSAQLARKQGEPARKKLKVVGELETDEQNMGSAPEEQEIENGREEEEKEDGAEQEREEDRPPRKHGERVSRKRKAVTRTAVE